MRKRKPKITRRQFVGGTATAAAFTIVLRHVLGGPGYVAPSEKVYIAVVGCGGQGRTNVRGLFSHDDAQIVAVADPMDQADYERWYYKGLAGRLPVKAEIETFYRQQNPRFKCNDYIDFEELLDKEKNIDAVLCATPDHWHAFVSMASMQRGKHIYCEKPLTHNIYEARTLAKAAKEAGVATQMGNQGRSDEGNPLACEMIWDGAIGQVREVHGWCNSPAWATGRGRPKDRLPVPKGLDWERWLGPRPSRPYHPVYLPVDWRGWWAFGAGNVGDIAVHDLDPAFAALNLDAPVSVEAVQTDFVDSEVIGDNNHIVWEYGPRGDMGPVTVHWHDGKLSPPRPAELEPGRRMGSRGLLIIGEKGTILAGPASQSPRIIPESKMRAYGRPRRKLPRSPGHHRNWLDACKGGPKACSDFSYSARLTEFILLANVAVRAKKKILWDGPNMRATNAPEADAFVRAQYRDGFDLERMYGTG